MGKGSVKNMLVMDIRRYRTNVTRQEIAAAVMTPEVQNDDDPDTVRRKQPFSCLTPSGVIV